VTGPFADLPRGHFKAIYADPPWSFRVWNKDTGNGRSAESHYGTMSMAELAALPVAELAADDCALFMWACWPSLPEALGIIDAWGFTYKTCGFDWMKAKASQIDMFRDDGDVQVGMGYWTRAGMNHDLVTLSEELRLVDLTTDIDLSLKLRRIGRERRQQRSRKGWETRRAHG
jgi:N6-adenosine-specific RNA methylase IME4